MRIRMGDLRKIISEEADPFAERASVFHAADALNKLDSADVEALPELLKSISQGARSPSVKKTMQRAHGLAVHLVHDFRALQALVVVAVKDMRRS